MGRINCILSPAWGEAELTSPIQDDAQERKGAVPTLLGLNLGTGVGLVSAKPAEGIGFGVS